MTTPREEKVIHDAFLVSVWIKGLVGLIQVMSGIALLLVTQAWLVALVTRFTTPELSEDPQDLIATFLRHGAAQWGTSTQLFAGIYLIIHGVIKVLLVAGLLRRKMWSYPASMWVLGAFIVYQCYRYTHTHSIWLLLLTALDVVVVLLIHHEYRQRKRIGFAPQPSHRPPDHHTPPL